MNMNMNMNMIIIINQKVKKGKNIFPTKITYVIVNTIILHPAAFVNDKLNNTCIELI